MKKFFSTVWLYIKKGFNVTVRFFKENIWASVLAVILAIVLFIVALQGIIKAIDSCDDDKIENRATAITSAQLEEKLEAEETFVLFVGSQDCAHCKQFYKTINRYIKDHPDTEIFYFDTNDSTDLGRGKMTIEIEQRLIAEIESDRGITSLATPTTIYIEDGEFKDAIQGAYGMTGGANYLIFCEVIEGKYVGKSTYTTKLETEGQK
jgi:predicted bacteriocin transport accessory protein